MQFRFAYRLQERVEFGASGPIHAMIETRGDHRPVKAGPATHFSHQQLNDVEVAEADHALGAPETRGKRRIDKVIGSVAAACRNHSINVLVVDGLAKLL